MTQGPLRIGELSRRVGVTPELLRAWESRYGLLRPTRTGGGFRLYSDEDVARVRRMQQLLDDGIAASEAARMAQEEEAAAPAAPEAAAIDTPVLHQLSVALTPALDAFDEAQAHWVLDRALGAFRLEAVLSELLLPYLRDLGERWERGEITVAQEHFASTLIRARLLALAQGWDRGAGPRALLACPSGERHDLPLVMFGLALRRHGWRITFLGADTPFDTLLPTAQRLAPDLIVLAATTSESFDGSGDDLRELTQRWQVALAGPGASPQLATALGATVLADDPVACAERVATA